MPTSFKHATKEVLPAEFQWDGQLRMLILELKTLNRTDIGKCL